MGCRAIELTYLRIDIDPKEILEAKTILDKFDFISVHARLDMQPSTFLKQFQTINRLINIKSVVFHPDRVENLNELNNFKNPAIENMDCRHNSYTTLQEMHKLSKKYNCKIVVDLAHLYSNNSDVANWKTPIGLNDKISHFHLSNPTNQERLHSVIQDKNKDIIEFAAKFKKPIIVEALPENLSGLKESVGILKKYVK